MGFDFRVGHPRGMFGDEDGEALAAMLREEFGEDLPLGDASEEEAIAVADEAVRGELGWSWWQELQMAAAERLGEDALPNLLSLDAWNAVYLDVRTPPVVYLADEEDDAEEPPPAIPFNGGQLGDEERAEIQALMNAMVDALAPPDGERDGLQIADLRGLRAELEAVAAAFEVEASDEAMLRLVRSYAESDDRADDDPHLQCLACAWLGTSWAIERGAPLWLVK